MKLKPFILYSAYLVTSIWFAVSAVILNLKANLVLITILALFSIQTVVQKSVAQDRTIVKIGFIYPLTGAMSSFGEDMAKALPILEKKFNSEQSTYKVELLLEDGKFGQGNVAITAAKKLVAFDGVKFLVVGSSGEILQVAPFAESAHVLTVAGFSSHPDVRKSGDYIFRTYIDIDRGLASIVDDILAKRITRVAVVTELSSFTSAVKDSLQKKLGNKIVFSEDYSLGDSDLKTIVTKARSKNPQAYYLNTTAPASFVSLFNTLRENGITELFYTYYVPTLKEVQESLGSKMDGTLYLDFPDISNTSDDFLKFNSTFEKENGEVANAVFNFKTNYNAIKVIFDAIMEVGPDSTKVKDFIYKYDRPSATGRLRFDSSGDAIDLNLSLKTFKAKS